MSDPKAAYPLLHKTQPLNSFAVGQAAVITSFSGGRRLQERMVALGIFPGQRLTICQNNGSSLVVSLNGSRLVLGHGVSQKIFAAPAGIGCHHQEACPCRIETTEDPS